MVKADLSRDYYADLGIAPTADLNEINKAYRKLALVYHPDRNPGNEEAVTPRFTDIKSAHEVLQDAAERAKYDANRTRSRYQSGGNSRGNPWSNVSSQYPAPPKAPTARTRPPPPSAGAQRYSNFQTPKQSANQSAQDGPEARRSTYEAWENMRNGGTKTGPGSSWSKPGPVPHGTPKSGREESNSYKHRPPPKAAPGYDEFRDHYSPATSPRRAQSSGAANRKGFTPNMTGGDEPPAPKGAYFTSHKPTTAPEPPPRNPPPSSYPQPPPNTPNPNVDPLRQFREKANVPYEPRLSTPYATHGGEKLNPFESANIYRSKSQRVPTDAREVPIPRAGSDSDLKSPHRTQSFAQSSRQARPQTSYAVPADSDSSEDSFETKTRRFAKVRSSKARRQDANGFPPAPPPATPQMPDGTPGQNSRKPSISAFQRWWKIAQAEDTPLNNASDGPSAGSGQTNQQSNGENPSMYGSPFFSMPRRSSSFKQSDFEVKLPTVSEHTKPKDPSFRPPISNEDFLASMRNKHPGLFSINGQQSKNGATKPTLLHPILKGGSKTASPPSGVFVPKLSPLEEKQRAMLDQLISGKQRRASELRTASDTPLCATSSRAQHCSGSGPDQFKYTPEPNRSRRDAYSTYRDPANAGRPISMHAEPGSLKLQQQKPATSVPHNLFGADSISRVWSTTDQEKKSQANDSNLRRFNFKVDDNTFQRTNSNGFSSSTENINTKFTPEEWEGKFEAGYFQPEQKAGHMPHHAARGRAQSGSRSRGRSPVKARPVDPHYPHHAHSESEIPAESPGGKKFSQEEWAGTFKPQTFMPPPPPPAGNSNTPQRPTRKNTRGSIIRPTMGTAAVVEDSDSSIEKPLFTGRKSFANATPQAAASPDAMDVDTPPVFKPTTPNPRVAPEGLGINTSPGKRPAASPAQSSSPIDANLKVSLEDLQIKDIISSMDLPCPPTAPIVPKAENDFVRPSPAAYAAYLIKFGQYMKHWDLFTNRIMLHLVARKNQNDDLGERRWLEDKSMETYRLGLREDKVVFGHLVGAQEQHAKVMKHHAVVRERMKEREERERPRKKVS